jgi:hypothetical protein
MKMVTIYKMLYVTIDATCLSPVQAKVLIDGDDPGSLSAGGEYTNWTLEGAAWFRSRNKKLPRLV